MSSTSRDELSATYRERGPLAGERLVEYNLFLSDAFGSGPPIGSFFDDNAIPDQIDGFANDDAYRRSRHYVLRQLASSNPNVSNMLRESSLARQLMEKPDQPATIRLIRRTRPDEALNRDPTQGGRQLPWVNVIPPNTKFFLENVIENREEKVQIVDTFGEWVAFFFGRRPEVYTYSGTLLNAKNHDWKNEFQLNYEYFLRGSQAVKYRATVFIQYDDVMVEGFLLNCSVQQNAASHNGVPFSFNLLVINRSPLNPRNLLALRFARSGGSAAEQQLFQNLQQALDLLGGTPADQALKRDQMDTFLLMREFFAGNYLPPAGVSTSFSATGRMQGQNSTAPGVLGGTVKQPEVLNPYQPTYTSRLDTNQLSGILGRDVTKDATPSLVGAGPPVVT
jgi:hypothetical protein